MSAPADLRARLLPAESRAGEIRGYLQAGRDQVRSLHDGGGSGHDVARAWTRCCDLLVRTLFRVLQEQQEIPPDTLALFALGEYGRTFLAPHSPLDLLLVHRDGFDPAPVMDGLLHPLWDSRLDVQGIARTPRENLAMAASDPRSLGNMIEGRLLHGSPELAQLPGMEQLGTGGGATGRELVVRMAEELRERHERYGGTVYLLEPQVVEGQGGLRDIQGALWSSRCRFGVRTVAGLVQKGLVPAGEIRSLEESRDFLLRLRNQLHLLCGRREDRLTVELQDEVAQFFGHQDSPERSGAEALLQDYYACANRVGHFVDSLMRRATAAPATGDPQAEVLCAGVRLQGGEIYLDPETIRGDPLGMLAAFEAAQRHDAELSPQALHTIRDNLDQVDDRFRRDPEAVALFLEILQRPRRVTSTLMRMHDVRFLDRFIPELEHTFGRVQRDPYHAYPVDVHSLFAVQELRRLARGEYREEFPQYTQVMAELERPHLAYLAALLHDVGKGHGSRHEERGAELAIQVAERMDLPPVERAYLEFLVREHLSLAMIAQGRDLHDEELIAGFAARVGDPQLLRQLHLLTFADVRAVGPTSWTSWKNLLFRELYEKTLAVLERGPARPDVLGERVEAARQRLHAAALELAPEAEVEAFLEHIDHPRYLLAHPLDVLVRHLAAFLRRGDAPVVELRAVPAEGYTELLLLTRDRPGLFAAVAGLLAAHNFNVLSAVLNTRTDGWVVDVFHVTVPGGEPLTCGPRWDRWREELAAALAGSGTLPEQARRRLEQSWPVESALPSVSPRVTVDNDVSVRFTVVDLSAPDRLGLLYDVSRALAEQGLTIRLAKIATMIRRVADAFYVEAVGGGKLTDPERLAELRRAIETAAAGNQQEGDLH